MRQGDLFARDPVVPGLLCCEEAISTAQERELAEHIDAAPLAPFRFQQWEGKRLTTSYGKAYDHGLGRPVDAPPLPEWLLRLRNQVTPLAGIQPDAIAQALLIRYDLGAGIGWHRDRPQYADVLGLSLSAPAVLRLRLRNEQGFERRSVELPPRSLYRLSGEVREEWEHSISPMAQTRRSITFRTLR